MTFFGYRSARQTVFANLPAVQNAAVAEKITVRHCRLFPARPRGLLHSRRELPRGTDWFHGLAELVPQRHQEPTAVEAIHSRCLFDLNPDFPSRYMVIF